MIRLPPLTLPVKQTLASRCSGSGPTCSRRLPVTTLSTPGGSFSAMRCTTRVVASGAVGGGFTIAVLPASSACGSEAPRIAIGQLKGTMMVTTRAAGTTRSSDRDARERAASTFAGVDLVGVASAPASSGSRRPANRSRPRSGSCRSPATGSRRRRRVAPSMPSSAASICSARCCGVRAAQAGYAALAAATASPTSCGVAEAA